MKDDLVPRSQATTAYDLFTDIAAAIQAEPARLNMSCILERAVDVLDGDFVMPNCGTVGCIAGWGLALTRRTTIDAVKNFDGYPESFLGLYGRFHRLVTGHSFVPTPLPTFDRALYELCMVNIDYDEPPGSPAYAAEFVRRIAAFQRKFEGQLKGRALA